MSLSTRFVPRLRLLQCSRCLTTKTSIEWPQRSPLGPFYEAVLELPVPLPNKKPENPPTSADPKVVEPTKQPSISVKPETLASTATTDKSAEEKIKLIFGSRYYGPEEKANRQAQIHAKSTYIGGTLVPPKPTEPDNCCMSGCVNCVWDLFREDMEEWNLKNAEAQKAMQSAEGSVDSDGGGAETNWSVKDTKIAKDLWDEDIYRDVPVGIREFMKQEKRIKERHAREGTVG